MSFPSTPSRLYVSAMGTEKTVSLVRTYTRMGQRISPSIKDLPNTIIRKGNARNPTSENANLSATSLVHSNNRVSCRVNLKMETGTVVTFASCPASLSHNAITCEQIEVQILGFPS